MKLLLVCQKAQEPLYLEDHKAYIKNAKKTNILVSDKKSLINAASPQLTPGICAATTSQQALMDLLELQFFPNPGLSDESHNCAYARKAVVLNKAFNIILGAYCLNIFPLSVLTIEAIDKIARCYFCIPLA